MAAVVFDSAHVPKAERSDAVRELISSAVVQVNLRFGNGDLADLRAATTDLGRLRVGAIRSNTEQIDRTARYSRDDLAPSVFVGLQPSGSTVVRQAGREAELSPGNLVLFDTTQPYELRSSTGFAEDYFRIPIAELGLPHAAVRQVSAVALAPGDPLTDLTGVFLRRLASSADSLDPAQATALGTPTVELVRALIATHLDDAALGKEAMRASLQLRILEHVRAHLGDPALSAARVAAAHHISVRHLYEVLEDISLGDWIRTRRLNGIRSELASPASRSLTIAAVARRWGYRDASSLGRAFRNAFGVTPREWREANRHPPN